MGKKSEKFTLEVEMSWAQMNEWIRINGLDEDASYGEVFKSVADHLNYLYLRRESRFYTAKIAGVK